VIAALVDYERLKGLLSSLMRVICNSLE
jgi:hypothetical protein